MKTKFIYYWAGVLFFFGILDFAFGLCNARVDEMAVLSQIFVLILSGMGFLVVSRGNKKSRFVCYLILCALGLALLIGMGMFKKPLFAWIVSYNILRWWCIGLIGASMLLTTIPSLVKKNVVGVALILMVEGGVLFFIALCWRTFVRSHPFITGDFFWCTGGLFALALAGFAVLLFIEGWKTRNKKSGSQPKTLESEAEIEFPGGAAYFPTSQKPKEEPVDKTPCNLSEMPFKVFFGQCCQFIKEEVLGAGWTGIIAGCVILWGAVDLVLVHFGI